MPAALIQKSTTFANACSPCLGLGVTTRSSKREFLSHGYDAAGIVAALRFAPCARRAERQQYGRMTDRTNVSASRDLHLGSLLLVVVTVFSTTLTRQRLKSKRLGPCAGIVRQGGCMPTG